MTLDFIVNAFRYVPTLIPLFLIFFIGIMAHFSATNKDHNALFPLALVAFVFVFMPLAVLLSE